MRLTGPQTVKIAEVSDGANVTVTRTKGQTHVDVHRLEDDLLVRVDADGTDRTLREANNE